MSLRSSPSWWNAVSLGILIVVIWLPRGLALDHFVTLDERKWLARSGNFYHALTHGDWAHTFQREHPGVTIMWAGTAGFLWRYPTYAREAPGQFGWSGEEIEPFLRTHGHEPLELLTAGRVLVVLGITAVLAAALLAAVRLMGGLPALIGFLLIALDPFHVALSRLLHLDGLMSSLMLLSLLAFLNYLYCGRRRFDLVVSAIAAGLGWLTKSPAFFLAPFAGLLMLVELWRGRHRLSIEGVRRATWPLVAWAGVGLAAFVLLWPAMWVDPVGSLVRIFRQATTYATEGHLSPVYFNGEVVAGDPGLRFYPVTYLWRTTPVVLVGLGLATVALALRRPPLAEPRYRRTTAVMALFAALFTLFMSLGAKKFDRYLLPVYAPLDLVAAMGWVAAARGLESWRFRSLARFGTPVLLGTAIVAQASGTLLTFPYYFSFYNPLLGGSGKAPQVMMIGWGEGLDQAARYLNAGPNAEQMRVMSWYPDGPFSYFFKGQTIPLGATWNRTRARQLLYADYLVLYIHQWQRQLPSRELLTYFAQQTPEHVVRVDGLEYARIYNLRDALPPDHLGAGRLHLAELEWADLSFEVPPMQHKVGVRFGDFAELLGYDLDRTTVTTDERVRLTLYWRAVNQEHLTTSDTVFTHLLSQDGKLIGQHDGIPARGEQPTTIWVPGQVIIDVHAMEFTDLEYAGKALIELGLYDSLTLKRVSTEDGRDHIILPTEVIVGPAGDG